jgi:hypothetical protein
MSTTLTVHDTALSGERLNSLSFEVLTERLTVRELIRARVYQEVQDYNQKQQSTYRGLVQPTDSESVLNGYRLRSPRQIDWKAQFDMALEAFQRNGFFVLIDEHQAEDLDEEVVIGRDTEINFVKLVPLVGG